jgi:hypothetical protein
MSTTSDSIAGFNNLAVGDILTTFIKDFSVFINFITPLLLAETVDSILGTEPSKLPAILRGFTSALGGREYLVRNLWIVGLILVT